MSERMKLYRVTCQGMQSSHGTAYVVATDTERAYKLLRKHLDEHDLGFHKERELKSVELIADSYFYQSCGNVLLIEGARAKCMIE